MLNPALTELAAVATDDGAPVDDGSPMGAVLALTAANSTPGECLSVARYRFLHHTAVSFVSSDIRVFDRSCANWSQMGQGAWRPRHLETGLR